MPKFERKPDIVEAVQWDGTMDGANTVAEFMKERDLRTSILLQVVFDSGQSYSRLYLNQVSGPSVPKNSWIVLGIYEGRPGPHILHPEDFEKYFAPKEG